MNHLAYQENSDGVIVMVCGSKEFKNEMDCLFHNRAPTKSGNTRRFFKKHQYDGIYHFDKMEEIVETFRRYHLSAIRQQLIDKQREKGIYSFENKEQRAAREKYAEANCLNAAKKELDSLLVAAKLNVEPAGDTYVVNLQERITRTPNRGLSENEIESSEKSLTPFG